MQMHSWQNWRDELRCSLIRAGCTSADKFTSDPVCGTSFVHRAQLCMVNKLHCILTNNMLKTNYKVVEDDGPADQKQTG